VIFLREIFAHICGLQHVWTLGGVTLPFCQRCTGLYVGSTLALVMLLALRPRPDRFQYWLHGTFLLLMVPYGFHLVPQGSILRTLTGFLFGFGLVYYLALNPLTAWDFWKPANVTRSTAYVLAVFATLSALLVLLYVGNPVVAVALTVIGTAGFVMLCLLILANLAVLPRTFHQISARTHPA